MSKVQELVNEGFALSAEIKAREERLETIKQALAEAADGNVVEFTGDGCKATVNYSARLASQVTAADLPKVEKLAGEFFGKLFCWSPVGKFRDVAKALLGDDKAGKLVAMLSGVPSPRVSFKAA